MNMKKTLLLSLTLLSGVAFANVTLLAELKSYTPENGSPTVGLFDTSGQLIDGVTYSGFQVSDTGVISTSGRPNNDAGATGVIDMGTHVNGLSISDFSLSFTATWQPYNDNAQWPNLVVFGEKGGDYTYKVFYSIVDNRYEMAAAGYGTDFAYPTQVGGLTPGGTHDYILTLSTAAGTEGRTISFYQDGALVLQATTNQYFGAPGNMRIGFGGSFGGDQGATITSLSNVKLYSGVIPEPTTATLSLLALAGLAARRRRR